MNIACPNCGRLNRPGARFCASCQTALGGADSVQAGGAPQSGGSPQLEDALQAGDRLQAGTLLGGAVYRVVRPLGKGGMGATFLVAQVRAFDRLAVLKEVIDYFDSADAQARRAAISRFEAEARILAELKHPGIPDLYAYFSEGGHNYLVMEYIEGQDLSRGLTRQDPESGGVTQGAPLAPEQALSYAIQICEVLEYLAAHQPPVVHNDIKPGNILLDGHSGRAVLVDFGTAMTRYLTAGGKPDLKKVSVYGTVGYAAPELYQGRCEPRSDVYSLAATTYHLLSDDDPRDHPAQYALLGAMPPALSAILSAALEPDVDRRLTAAAFRQQLEGYLAGQTAPLHALTFPDGDSANGRTELIAQALKHWSYTAGLLQDGTLPRWLRGTLRDSVAAKAAEEALKQVPGNPEIALDLFLYKLDPQAAQPGKMELRTPSIRVTGVSTGQPIRAQIELANRGPGYVRGEAYSTMPWVQVDGVFGCPPGDACSISIVIDPAGLATGQSYLAAVTLAPAGGSPEVVPVELPLPPAAAAAGRSAPPRIAVEPHQIDLTAFAGDTASTRKRLAVTNTGSSPARCRMLGAPAWLVVTPEAFLLAAGASQFVELVARVAKVSGRHQEAGVSMAVEGGQERAVRVSIQIKGKGIFG